MRTSKKERERERGGAGEEKCIQRESREEDIMKEVKEREKE